ncbi:carbohydrate deacetylase [Mucilaginibacter pedocola]|uniref:ChbG/HpnK family deacetylase n=1 Tax=Mucilaginibacter pedocola TaxID=1792845 RepID=A0A1S9P836_9SPHI|nr:ChbG/HpnK family deacetylase [Mucilaginibacter pedocola]OOQ57102.1 hypothetical protein BC343_16375 [Mucilaginibacter pedocola]
MLLAGNILANADDFGIRPSVNKAILQCFENGYINSTSLMSNMPGFAEAVQMAHDNVFIKNIGAHINMAEGLPLTNVGREFLNSAGEWDLQKTGRASNFYSSSQKAALLAEISAQVNKALASGVQLTHIDSHYHLHTLPGMYALFLAVAKQYKLKIRLAQTYREGSFLKYWYRLYINSRFAAGNLAYTEHFHTVEYFLGRGGEQGVKGTVEVMLHPDIDSKGGLTDHYDPKTMVNWLTYIQQTHGNS